MRAEGKKMAQGNVTKWLEKFRNLRGDKFRVEAVWGLGQDDEKTVAFTSAPQPETPPEAGVRPGFGIKIYDFTLKLLPGTHLADETWKM